MKNRKWENKVAIRGQPRKSYLPAVYGEENNLTSYFKYNFPEVSTNPYPT